MRRVRPLEPLPIPIPMRLETDMDYSDTNELWDNILESGIVSEETLQVVSAINGYSVDTLTDVLYAVTGNRDWDQFTAEIGN